MNDFLGNLLARSERIPSGVRPRLATRYEPPPLASAEFEIPSRAIPPIETRGEPLSVPPKRPEPGLGELFPASSLPEAARPVSATISEVTRPTPPSQPPALTPAPPPVPTSGERAEPAFQTSPPPLLAPAGPVSARTDFGNELPIRPEPPAARREIFTERVILNRELVHERDPLASQPRPPADNSRAGETVPPPAGRSQEPPGPASDGLETIRATRLSPPARTTPPAGGLDAPAVPASPPPGPTIEVTIGRIEVRATPPPTQPARERKQRAALSLEEYMRQRNGGRG